MNTLPQTSIKRICHQRRQTRRDVIAQALAAAGYYTAPGSINGVPCGRMITASTPAQVGG